MQSRSGFTLLEEIINNAFSKNAIRENVYRKNAIRVNVTRTNAIRSNGTRRNIISTLIIITNVIIIKVGTPSTLKGFILFIKSI
jgi:hypothetical protein